MDSIWATGCVGSRILFRISAAKSNLFSYLLTPWYRILLEKLTGLQLIKKFPHFTEPEGSLPHSQASPPVSILGQPNPVHIPTSHLLEIHPNIIHPFTPRSPQWSPSLRFPHKTLYTPPLSNFFTLAKYSDRPLGSHSVTTVRYL